MKRLTLAALLALAPLPLAAQVSPAPVHHPHPRPHARHRQPATPPLAALPPMPAPAPGFDESRFVAAPTPDPDINAPGDRPKPAISMQPEILQEHVTPTGQGYTYGSTPEAIQNADTARAPGVGIDIPVR